MTKQRLLHRPRPVLYDSGVVSRVLDDMLGPSLNDFVLVHQVIQATREVFISQTTVFELQPVLRVLKKRYQTKSAAVEEVVNDFAWLMLDEAVGDRAISLKRGLEQIEFADATIAATALVHDMDLFTLNEADFALIPGLRLYKPRNYAELLVRLGASKPRGKE